jgi:hypothetical protein
VTVRSRLIFKSVRFQYKLVELLLLEQRVDGPNFIFVDLMEALGPDRVPGNLACQKLAILAISANQ